MQNFDYVRVHEIQDAISILSREQGGVHILAGGTDLLVQLREGQRTAKLLLDIKSIPEVNRLAFDPSIGLTLGSAVSCLRISRDPLVSKNYPGLVDAVSLIGGIQIQGRASVGGNLCNASPAADTIPALIVHQAVCVIVGPDGEREVSVDKFCRAPGENILEPGELLLSLRIPTPPAQFGASYLRFTPRNEMDIAVVGAGASLVLTEDLQTVRSAKIALAAVAPKPLLVNAAGEYLAGRQISPEVIREASELAKEAVNPIQDMRGTVEQRRHLAGVLTRRALQIAVQRAKSKPEF